MSIERIKLAEDAEALAKLLRSDDGAHALRSLEDGASAAGHKAKASGVESSPGNQTDEHGDYVQADTAAERGIDKQAIEDMARLGVIELLQIHLVMTHHTLTSRRPSRTMCTCGKYIPAGSTRCQLCHESRTSQQCERGGCETIPDQGRKLCSDHRRCSNCRVEGAKLVSGRCPGCRSAFKRTGIEKVTVGLTDDVMVSE